MSILKTDTELRALIDATGLTYSRLAERFDCHEQTVQGWYRGNRPPRNRGLVITALQLIVLEHRGIVTAKLIEAAEISTTGRKLINVFNGSVMR